MRDAARELADLQAHDDLAARIYADHLPGDLTDVDGEEHVELTADTGLPS